jgi:HK97 gp10 family phage protein
MARSKSSAVAGVKVDGLKDLQKQLRQAQDKDMKAALRMANKSGATIVADEARTRVPVRTGRLKASIGARAGQSSATVKAGTPGRVPYAGPIHFGWRERGITPQPFLYEALGAKWDDVYKNYDDQINKLIQTLNKQR